LLSGNTGIIIYHVLTEHKVEPEFRVGVAHRCCDFARRRVRRRGRATCSRFGELELQISSLFYNGEHKLSSTARVSKPAAAPSGVHLYNLVYWSSVSQRERARFRASSSRSTRAPVRASAPTRASRTSRSAVFQAGRGLPRKMIKIGTVSEPPGAGQHSSHAPNGAGSTATAPPSAGH
jgi:hypothetical protein